MENPGDGMKRMIIFSSAVLLWSGLAAAQVNGQATVVSGYATTGVYSMPIVPLVRTPSLTLEPAILQTPTNDATADNNASQTGSSYNSGSFDFGAARSEDSYGAAELKSRFHPRRADKVYTNQDIARVNDTNGLVKFGNKTEQL
jgi:hypothetical protein